jgi:hypothetical protein
MREVVIQSWCDVCATNGDEAAGDPFDLVWQGRDYSLDLCAEHAETIHEFERLLADHGQPNRSKPKSVRRKIVEPAADGSYVCPECGKPCASAQGLGAHRRSHGRRVAKA